MSGKKIIAYWHNSLCDAELMGIDMLGQDAAQVSLTAVEAGRLDAPTTQALFQKQNNSANGDEPPDEEPLTVLIAPIVATQTYQHGYQQRAETPRLICPLLIPAILYKGGALAAAPNLLPWIPRTLLEPTNANLVLGDIKTFDDFMTNQASGLEQIRQNWHHFLAFAWKMLAHVTQKQGRQMLADAGYKQIEDRALIINATIGKGMASKILGVYDKVLSQQPLPPLLARYTDLQEFPPAPSTTIEQWRDSATRHLGSVNKQFPLSPSQREAFYNFLALPRQTILAVSGPPGTGKTTLLHSVIASLWVEAAVNGNSPPVIVCSSTNNQAVTNIIDSLSQIGGVTRWLPVESFGLYLVNDPKKQENADKNKTLWINKWGDGFPLAVEGWRFVDETTPRYLRHCSAYFRQEVGSVDQAVNLLHNRLQTVAQRLKAGIDAAYDLSKVMARWSQLCTEFNNDMNGHLAHLEEGIEESKQAGEKLQELKKKWLHHCQSEPAWYTIFSFLGAVRQRQRTRNALFIHEQMAESAIEPETKVINRWLSEAIQKEKERGESAQAAITAVRAVETEMAYSMGQWQSWRKENNAIELDKDHLFTLETATGTIDKANLLNWLDTHLRFELFDLTTHYWEGRWLQTITDSSILKANSKERQDRQTQENRWRRYAMLTPCFVTTMHTGPSFFDYYSEGSQPLFDFIDLLIVDEAGQVTPEVSGAMFALAQQALVVGDTLQIEPVWNIPTEVDRGNLMRNDLVASDEDVLRLQQKGITADAGSVMQIAQQLSPYQIPSANDVTYERGMFLAEHRRCVPEIIGYCNELAYGGRLKVKRPSIENYPWPHMGYLHVKGKSELSGGSRKNVREALAIVAWIAENKERLEGRYQTTLDNILGIVTPFAAQRQLLIRELGRQGTSISKTGTVHALQGAERPVVLFSSVYTSRDPGPYFFDRGPNMLNVAVSRAKDSFLVFGDMEIFDPHLRTPSGLLAKYLFAGERNEISDAPLPTRIPKEKTRTSHRIRSLQKHQDTLARAFASAEKRLIIISPYLRWRAVEADKICEKTAEAKARGVDILIYVDDGFNDNLKLPSAARAAEALERSGATVQLCHNIHSKIICKDEDVFIEGSFNWLSAERVIGNYQRYDTSTIHTGPRSAQFIVETLSDIEQRLILKKARVPC
jgi:RecA/RadA recombinase